MNDMTPITTTLKDWETDQEVRWCPGCGDYAVLKAYDRVVIPEMNLGQLAHVIRARFLVDALPFNQVSGLPFTAATLENMLEDVVKNG